MTPTDMVSMLKGSKTEKLQAMYVKDLIQTNYFER